MRKICLSYKVIFHVSQRFAVMIHRHTSFFLSTIKMYSLLDFLTSFTLPQSLISFYHAYKKLRL